MAVPLDRYATPLDVCGATGEICRRSGIKKILSVHKVLHGGQGPAGSQCFQIRISNLDSRCSVHTDQPHDPNAVPAFHKSPQSSEGYPCLVRVQCHLESITYADEETRGPEKSLSWQEATCLCTKSAPGPILHLQKCSTSRHAVPPFMYRDCRQPKKACDTIIAQLEHSVQFADRRPTKHATSCEHVAV